MSDFDNDQEGPIDVPEPGAAPVAPPADIDAAINRNRQIALGQLAKSEDISNYVDERADQFVAMDLGEELGAEAQAKWFRRAHKALQDAALEAQGIKLDEQGQPELPPPPPPGYVPGDEAAREIEDARKTGAAAMRVDQFLGGNEEPRQNIVEWHQAMDPEGHVAQWLIDNESSMAGPIMQRCADNPEALQQLAQMSPSDRSRWLSKLEGHLEAELRIGQQLAGQQQQWQQQRRETKAPPIIHPPRGAANPPSDLFRMASRDDVTDYIREREKQLREEWKDKQLGWRR
jgi:hypothetical protein